MSEFSNNEAMTDTEPAVMPPKKNKIIKELVDYVEILIFAICFVIIVFSFFFRICSVDGASMNNTLVNGEKLIVSDLFYTPEHGDVIVFHDTDTLNKPVVKRVIAIEGERINIKYLPNSMVVVVTDKDGNQRTLVESYIVYEYQKYFGEQEYLVPEGKVFVMGDNRNDSTDSRMIGCVDNRSILGKVIFRISPISKIGTV